MVWCIALKASAGFSKPIPSLIATIAMIASVALLAYALRHLPVGTAYPVWTGIGAVGAFIVGVWAFSEPVTTLRVISALFIVAGIIGMRLSSE